MAESGAGLPESIPNTVWDAVQVYGSANVDVGAAKTRHNLSDERGARRKVVAAAYALQDAFLSAIAEAVRKYERVYKAAERINNYDLCAPNLHAPPDKRHPCKAFIEAAEELSAAMEAFDEANPATPTPPGA